MTYCLKLFIFLTMSLLLACCHFKEKPTPVLKTRVIHLSVLHKTLKFSGIIQPLHVHSLVSPVDGTIDKLHYHYGQWIKKNTIVFTLNSADLEKRYNDAVTDYLKAKDSYTVAKTKFSGTEELWKSGLLSNNNYLSEKSTLNTERITLMQSSRKLSELLEKMGEGSLADDEISGLSLSEFDKVQLELMNRHHVLEIKSAHEGILLYPPKNTEDQHEGLTVGSSVKTDQVLGLIGDMTGIRIDIDIPEIDMNSIKVGMPAMIKGIAFGKNTFLGELVALNAQASNKNNMLPSFTAIVEVKPLDKHAQQLIKVGMSATVELHIKSEHKLLVPIQALKQHAGQTTVTLITPSGKKESRIVTTGGVHGQKVIIDKGLTPGDIIEYRDDK